MQLNPPAQISVIIPTADEAEVLPQCLERIAGMPNEIMVVDAESEDDTSAIAQRFGCELLTFPERHRARQMNFGAARARGEILLFLHADTLLPEHALTKIVEAMKQAKVVGGGFARRYRSPSRLLALTCRLAAWRNRFFGWHLGDQAMFVRREVFLQLGGFRDIAIFEDLDFSRRLHALGHTITLHPPVLSSARRFAARGPFRTTLDDLRLTRRYLAGVDPNELCNTPSDHVEANQPKTYEHLS